MAQKLERLDAKVIEFKPASWARREPGRFPAFPAVVREQLEQAMLECRHAAALAAAGETCLPLLLVGDPGCGKTSAGGWIAQQLGRPLFDLSAPTRDSYMGVTAKNIERVFGEMSHPSPAVWLIDEFDSLGECRASKAGGTESEVRHVIGTLLKIFDRLPLGQVLVCTTNLVEAVDPAIRRRMQSVRWPAWRELVGVERRTFCRSHGLDDYRWGSYAEAIEAARACRVRRIIEAESKLNT
jgi:hypothetical protein